MATIGTGATASATLFQIFVFRFAAMEIVVLEKETSQSIARRNPRSAIYIRLSNLNAQDPLPSRAPFHGYNHSGKTTNPKKSYLSTQNADVDKIANVFRCFPQFGAFLRFLSWSVIHGDLKQNND